MRASRSDQIDKRIDKIKVELAKIDDMRPGSLTEQRRKPEDEHGYYQLSYTHAGRGRTEYIPRSLVRNVRREIANYKRFKELTMEWIDLSIEKSRLRIKAAADKT